jgi:hypothetical protein
LADGGERRVVQPKHREFGASILTGKDTTSSPFTEALKTMEVAEMILARSLLFRPKR